jgi:transcriptional regulator with XRE-family HTH domain
MKITNQATDEALLRELGGRLAQARLEKNLTQAQLAIQAGISKRTVERLEAGKAGTQLSAFVRVCRALELIERLEILVPETAPSPMTQLKLGGRKRRRASAPKAPGAIHESAPGTWTWGDKS